MLKTNIKPTWNLWKLSRTYTKPCIQPTKAYGKPRKTYTCKSNYTIPTKKIYTSLIYIYVYMHLHTHVAYKNLCKTYKQTVEADHYRPVDSWIISAAQIDTELLTIDSAKFRASCKEFKRVHPSVRPVPSGPSPGWRGASPPPPRDPPPPFL